MTELTKEQQRPAHLWRPGQSGNLAGRPKGSKNKLSEDFIGALYVDFQDHGAAAIAACRAEKPDVYVRVIASLLPKDVNLTTRNLDDLSDDQLMRKLAALTEMARPLLAKLPAVIDVTPSADVEPQRNPTPITPKLSD
jgi:Family of unknown function (DUF5681)